MGKSKAKSSKPVFARNWNLGSVTHVNVHGHNVPVYLAGSVSLYVTLPAGVPLPVGATRAAFRTQDGASLVSIPARGAVLIRAKNAAPSDT